jgi:hypothetical protein
MILNGSDRETQVASVRHTANLFRLLVNHENVQQNGVPTQGALHTVHKAIDAIKGDRIAIAELAILENISIALHSQHQIKRCDTPTEKSRSLSSSCLFELTQEWLCVARLDKSL